MGRWVLWDVRPGKEKSMTLEKKIKDENMTLGKTIKMARVYNDFSSKKVAKMAGIALSTYNNIEKGITKNPELATLKKISEILGLDLMELLNLVGR